MNLLIENTPDYIEVGGIKYKIKTDFSLWVKLFISMDEQNEHKTNQALLEIFEEVPQNAKKNEIITAISEWLEYDNKGNRTRNATTNSNKSFDFSIDGNIIFCELWEHFPHLMERGITYHQGMELIKLLMANEKTMLHHRAFARVGDFSKMSKEQRNFWQQERAKYIIRAKQEDIDAVFSRGFK